MRLDPLELINIVDRPEFREVRRTLAARLDRWLEETDDFVLRKEVPRRYEPPGFGPWEGKTDPRK